MVATEKPALYNGSVDLVVLFAGVAAVRLLCALYSIIPDCDEVFNYWEPTHYMTHGSGLQTWEYSPQYGIRSWAYIAIHAFLISVFRLIRVPEKYLFYALRAALGSFCAYCEVVLYAAIHIHIDKSVAVLTLLFSVSSTGMFHASVTYLPSSFSMYFTMLAVAQLVDGGSVARPQRAIVLFAISAVLGWPFAAALAVPFAIELLYILAIGKNIVNQLVRGIMCSFGLLCAVVVIDSVAYKKLQVVPLNIVLYNVFGSKDTGPDIFGTEPVSYYILNLLLNFNVVAVLAYCVGLVLIVRMVPWSDSLVYTSMKTSRLVVITTPLLLWTVIFFRQPHKEERFFYVVYPLICLNAAIALHAIYTLLLYGLGRLNVSMKKINSGLSYLFRLLIIAFSLLCAFRILALREFYHAPLSVYSQLFDELGDAEDIVTVCVGREWYRYPSSYMMPANARLKFVKSGFDGLLPTEFKEGVSWWTGVSAVPWGLNNKNQEQPEFYVDPESCDYMIDTDFATGSEERRFVDEEEWTAVFCERFLDAENSSMLGRVLKLPDWAEAFERQLYIRKWGEYCLLRRNVEK